MNLRKIAVIGNAGGGKTTLSRVLSEHYELPVFHVDRYQFLPGLNIRPYQETIQTLSEIQAKETWIIDGFGPLDIIEKRFQLADCIILVDFAIWRHYFWTLKRQIKSLWSPRAELPEGCNEVTWTHTLKLFRTIWKVHTQMRPELLRILARDVFKDKVIIIKSFQDFSRLCQSGLSGIRHLIGDSK